MADIENKYLAMDGVDSQPVTRGRWFKVGIALFCGSGLVLFSSMAQSMTNATETVSTNLMGLSTSLRASPVAGLPALKGTGQCPLPGCGPWQKLALAAIQDVNAGRSVRGDISLAQATKAEEMAGVTGPLGFWDPLKLSADIPEGKLMFFREAELKHGRVSMLAALGVLVAEKFYPVLTHFGGNPEVSSLGLFQEKSIASFWPAIVISLYFFEAQPLADIENGEINKPDYVPGDLGWDPLGFKPKDAKGLKEMQTKELNNGRLAMFASLGMLAQEAVTGHKLDLSNLR